MKLRLLFLTFLFSALSWGQILTFEFSALAGNEVSANSNFNDPNLGTSTITRGSGLTAATNAGRFNATNWALTSIANAVSGNKYMEFTITPNATYSFDVTSVVVNLQRSNTGPREIALRSSVDGYSTNLDTAYLIADNTATQTFTFTFSQIGNSSAVTYRIYMWAEATGGSGGIGDFAGDDIIVNGSVYSGSPTPTINVSPTTLTGFTYVVGSGPSAEQTFDVSGSNLTNDIVLTAPTNYEISTTSGAGFTNSITLTQSGGNVANTTIYVRLVSGLSIGAYNGEVINCTSTGATTQTVTCDGDVTGSALSDIVTAGGEVATVSSLENDAVINTTADGVQVWQFTIRDGGAVADPDNLATIVNSLVVTQAAGNAINDWADAIQAVALFNGATKIADGVVTTNTITFSGAPLISIPDNGNVTLSVRLSVQTSPNDSGSNLDGDDFVFSINNTNATADGAGSQFTNFAVASSTNGLNVLDIVATQLIFIQQPNSTGLGSPMANVIVGAVDANGNIDTNFSGNIAITSTGTMTGDPITIAAVSGQAIFSAITHTVLGTGLTLDATSIGLMSVTSTIFDITTVTAFAPGDFAVIALNSNISCYPAGPNGAYSAGDDEISFMVFKDILNGDTFYITDNGYERTTAGLWGDTEGVTQIIRTGGTIPAGTIITIRLRNSAPIMEFVSPDTNWSFSKAVGFTGSLVMNSGGDQIFFMQGGTWNNPAGTHDATYTPGEYLYAFNTNSSWTSFGSSTQQSGLPLGLECFSLLPGSATDFLEYTGPVTPAPKLDWIARLNNPTNWTNRVNCAGYTSMHVGQTYSITPGGTYVDGVWVGSKSTDWFDCANWQTLKVPDTTINVDINNTYAVSDAVIDITSPYALTYSNLALANNLSVTDRKLIIEANPSNVLEVHGNLLIDGTGVLDMDDAVSGTPDGTLHLFGNWTNNIGESAFLEGEGSVHFDGSTPQIISNVTPEGTEIFYDVVMNNDFTTSVSNDLIANGDLIVNTGKTVTVKANDYIQVGFDLTVDGTFNVEDDGSLIQVDDSGVNVGNINYERTTTGVALDYVYWSSPVNSVNTPATGYVYSWNPTFVNPNGGWGYWILSRNTSMAPGVGYIMRDVFSRTFTGVPRNGVIQPSISRANYTNVSGFTGTNGVLITRFDDNWNLVGNPYPSAISALDFLNANPNIEGAVRIWTHGTSPDPSIADPVYDDYVYNYTVNDYIVHNGTGTVSGPAGFNGFIAGGQSFMINMNDGASATETVTFNNSMRNRTHNNEQFYKQTSSTKNVTLADEKHRIWLDLADANNNSVRTLVGYVSGATTGKDRLYDAVSNAQSNGMNIFSIINDERMLIQGRGVPFDVNDKVQLSVNIPSSGLYSIGLSAVDGLFSDGQDIYLEDKVLNIIFDIKQMPYTFYAEQGEFKNRFILRFTNETLGIEDTISEDSVAVFSQENNISISSASETIESVMVYNVLGQLLFKENNINSNNMVISKLTRNNQALIVKVNFNNGKEITRKILF